MHWKNMRSSLALKVARVKWSDGCLSSLYTLSKYDVTDRTLVGVGEMKWVLWRHKSEFVYLSKAFFPVAFDTRIREGGTDKTVT